jgi:hypothetical protein
MIELEPAAPPELDTFRQRALLVGVAGLALCGILAFTISDRAQFFRSYLVGFMFWIGIALGSLAILMLQHMSGGAWGLVIRRPLESATRTFPLLLLFFLPIAFGLPILYIWATPEAQHDVTLAAKHVYLNQTFFLIRAAFYFSIWLLFGHLLSKWSVEQDHSGDSRITRRIQLLSGPGLLLYGGTVTYASIDWVMSIEPAFYSTIYGLLFMAGQGLSALAFMIAVLVLLQSRKPLAGLIAPSHLHDLGKLMLAFVMIWAYLAFSQFLIVWSGNLQEEVPWYLRRMQGPWMWIGLALIVFHFALPFVMLLSRDLKRNAKRLSMVAVLVIVMRLVDLLWMIVPEFHGHGLAPHLMDIAAPVGLGGIWVWFFLTQLKKQPLLPVGDSNLEAALATRGGH